MAARHPIAQSIVAVDDAPNLVRTDAQPLEAMLGSAGCAGKLTAESQTDAVRTIGARSIVADVGDVVIDDGPSIGGGRGWSNG